MIIHFRCRIDRNVVANKTISVNEGNWVHGKRKEFHRVKEKMLFWTTIKYTQNWCDHCTKLFLTLRSYSLAEGLMLKTMESAKNSGFKANRRMRRIWSLRRTIECRQLTSDKVIWFVNYLVRYKFNLGLIGIILPMLQFCRVFLMYLKQIHKN